MKRGKPKLPVVSEKVEQQSGVALLRSIGCAVYVLGTTRPKADSYHGTRQTPGIADVIALLPYPGGVLFWEAKRKGGKVRPEQIQFGLHVEGQTDAGHAIYHCLGTYDTLIAWLMAYGFLKGTQVPAYRLPAGLGDGAGTARLARRGGPSGSAGSGEGA